MKSVSDMGSLPLTVVFTRSFSKPSGHEDDGFASKQLTVAASSEPLKNMEDDPEFLIESPHHVPVGRVFR